MWRGEGNFPRSPFVALHWEIYDVLGGLPQAGSGSEDKTTRLVLQLFISSSFTCPSRSCGIVCACGPRRQILPMPVLKSIPSRRATPTSTPGQGIHKTYDSQPRVRLRFVSPASLTSAAYSRKCAHTSTK